MKKNTFIVKSAIKGAEFTSQEISREEAQSLLPMVSPWQDGKSFKIVDFGAQTAEVNGDERTIVGWFLEGDNFLPFSLVLRAKNDNDGVEHLPNGSFNNAVRDYLKANQNAQIGVVLQQYVGKTVVAKRQTTIQLRFGATKLTEFDLL